MSSQAKIDAARANGAKSKGPVTPAGKLASAANNLRHGLLARSVVLDAESREIFYQLFKDFEMEFEPVGPLETALVQTLVVTRWRQMRVWGMETAAIDHQIAKQDEAVDPRTRTALAFRALCDQSRSLEVMNRYETRYDRQFNRTLTRLIKVQDARRGKNNEFCHSNPPHPGPPSSESA